MLGCTMENSTNNFIFGTAQNLKSFLFITMYERKRRPLAFQDVQKHFVNFQSVLETCFKKESYEKAFQEFASFEEKVQILATNL